MNTVKVLALICLVLVAVTAKKQIKNKYDFVVAGTGTSGSILCSELSEDRKIDVLCLDIGRDESEFASSNPGFMGSLPPNEIPWLKSVRSEEQTLGARDLNTVIPQLLGGGSSANGNLHQRMTVEDQANFGSNLWTYEATLEDWKELETSFDRQDPINHGFEGPIGIIHPQPDNLLSSIRDQMLITFGQDFNNDTSNGSGYGVGEMARNVAYVDGVPIRQDSYSKILKPVLGRNNLDLVDRAMAIKAVLKEKNGVQKVDKIVFSVSDGKSYEVKIGKELIISLGVLRSPKFLQLSGIGNCDDLEEVGIECLVSNSEVGYNLADGAVTSQLYATPFPVFPGSVAGAIMGLFYATPGSPVVNMETSVAVIPNALPVPNPDGTVSLYNAVIAQLAHLVHPAKGWVKPTSDNVFDADRIKFNFYSNLFEIAPFVYNFKKTREMMGSLGVYFEISPGYSKVPLTATDEEIAAYLAAEFIPLIHGIGTCSINKVVNERLVVNGVSNMRVVDNSIIPQLLTSHSTSAASMLIGKVGARLIKEDNNL